MTDEQNTELPSLRQTIDKTTYEVVLHFNDQSTQTVEDRLRKVILHDLRAIMGERKSCNKVTVPGRFQRDLRRVAKRGYDDGISDKKRTGNGF